MSKLRSTLFVFSCAVAIVGPLGAPPTAHAETYLEKKDTAAKQSVERALARLARNPALFDGTAIPAGADLARVQGLLDDLNRGLDQAVRGLNEMSDAGLARADVQALRAKFDDLDAYRKALAPVVKASTAQAAAAKKAALADEEKRRGDGIALCEAFHAELGQDLTPVALIGQFADTGVGSWNTVEDGAKYKAALAHARALCAKPVYADVDAGCTARGNRENVCAIAKRGDELVARTMTNFVEFHVKNFALTRNAENLAANAGWIDSEAPTTWAATFSSASAKAKLEKHLGPVLAQAGIAGVPPEVAGKLDAVYAALEAKVRELAPTWKLEGTACGGVGCGVAKAAIARWYPKARVLALRQSRDTWKISKNALDVPTGRYKDGFALLQLPGEPFCQLRSWTVRETYAGGGRYQPTPATIGYVRWQACK